MPPPQVSRDAQHEAVVGAAYHHPAKAEDQSRRSKVRARTKQGQQTHLA
jgi:hypothetical protein